MASISAADNFASLGLSTQESAQKPNDKLGQEDFLKLT